jgi:hypothetical protein
MQISLAFAVTIDHTRVGVGSSVDATEEGLVCGRRTHANVDRVGVARDEHCTHSHTHYNSPMALVTCIMSKAGQ